MPSPIQHASPRWVWLALAAVYLIWGSTYYAMRVVVETVPPFFMAGTRFLVAGAVLFAFSKARGAHWPSKREWAASAPIGVLMFVLGNGTVAYAEKHISSGVAAVVCGTMSLWVAALNPLFNERTSRREWVGLVLGFFGIFALALGDELSADVFSAAVLMLAPISWALGSLLARRLPLPKGAMASAAQMLIGGAVMSVMSLLAGERIPSHFEPRAIAAWVYLGVFGSLLAYTAYMYLLRTARPAVATSYSYVNPGIAVLIGAALGNERLGPEMFVALLMICAATVLVVMKPRART